MLLTITTTHQPANDLGYLLHKHPDRFQSFDLSFGKAHVYYPEIGAERCSACLLLDIDAVGMVRGKNPDQSFLLGQYVNDRPYVASSFLSVAIAQVFSSALQGRAFNSHCSRNLPANSCAFSLARLPVDERPHSHVPPRLLRRSIHFVP
jgi:hypothetical protein